MRLRNYLVMILAVGAVLVASAAADDAAIPAADNAFTVAPDDWRAIEYPRDIIAGSILDFSGQGLHDAPAGKYGRVIVENGKFVFAGRADRPQRFYGANLCMTANYLDQATCDRLADRFAAIGYNSVRLHHHDNYLASRQSGTVLHAENLNKLDYLFAAMKKRGIYVTTDLFVSRRPRSGELPGVTRQSMKGLMPLADEVLENQMQFSQAWMEHVNPYTGLAWKDDPALGFISIINEDTVYHHFKTRSIRERYLGLFAEYLQANAIEPGSELERTHHLNDFLIQHTVDHYGKMMARLRGFGLRVPLTGQNMWMTVPLSLIRDHFDYVDTHGYWDHPVFLGRGWQLPMRFWGISSMAVELTGEQATRKPARLFPARIYGKPFVTSEIGFCFPNPYRAESGALVGAYGALQDWDGIYKFAYSHSAGRLTEESRVDLFDVATDPVQLLAEKLAILLFLRGDVRAADEKIALLVDARKKIEETGLDEAEHSNSHVFAGFVGQLGTVIVRDDAPSLPAGIKVSFEAQKNDSNEDVALALARGQALGLGGLDMSRKWARSSTGELELNGAEQHFLVTTAKTEAIVTVHGGRLSSGLMTIDNQAGFALLAVSAMDSQPVKDSKRMLFLHVTDVKNSEMKFKTPTIVETWGTPPLLARRGVAEIRLQLTPGDAPSVYAVDLAGKRLGQVNSNFSAAGELSFTSDSFAFAQPCFAYEISR